MSQGPKNLIVSLHIPKTGGTSFLQVLERAFPGQVAYFYRENNKHTHPRLRNRDGLRDPSTLAALEADGIRVIHGHAPAKWFLNSVPDPSRYWTWLRDPVERVISAYYYQLQRNEKSKPGSEKVAGLSLEEFARLDGLRNGQTKMLRGLELNSIGFVGVTERFEESLALLNLGQPQRLKPRNRNSAKPQVDAAIKKIIAELNQDDLALYREAQERLDRAAAKGAVQPGASPAAKPAKAPKKTGAAAAVPATESEADRKKLSPEEKAARKAERESRLQERAEKLKERAARLERRQAKGVAAKD